jgi:hypothetical protein
MGNAAKKARKRAHRESGYSEATAYEHEPKRPTGKYRTRKQEQASRRRERQINQQGDQMAAMLSKLTRSQKSVDEVMER